MPLNMTGPLFPGGGMSETYYPLSACDEPMSTVAALFNVMITLSIGILALMAVIKYFAGTFGYAPIGQMLGTYQESSRVRFK